MLRRSFTSTITPFSRTCAVGSHRLPATTFLATSFYSAMRFAGAPAHAGPLDHSASMAGHIDADMQHKIDLQAKRTVAAFVPGKVFMRHWIANVQAFESIYNRIISLIITGAIIVYGSVYASNSGSYISGLNSATFFMFALFAIFLPAHTHHLWHGGVLIGAYLIAVNFGLLG